MWASVFLHLIPVSAVGLACQPSASEGWCPLSALSEGGEAADLTFSLWSCCLSPWDMAKATCDLSLSSWLFFGTL